MDAIQLKFSTKSTNKTRKAVVVDTEVCIGCGVCAHKCKARSITLKRREETTEPPKTASEWVPENIMELIEAKAKSKGETTA